MDADVLTTRVADRIAVITLGTAKRIYIDQETSDALFEALNTCAGDADIRVVIVTGAAPGMFVRHYSIPELIGFAESVRATGREWPEARFIDGPISVCERMPKPVIAAISGTCLAGAFELTLACDQRIAADGDYQIGFRRRTVDSARVPAAHKGCHARSERQPRSCTSSWACPSLPAKPNGGASCTKPSAARRSIARWRLPGICPHSRRSRLPASSVSSAAPPRGRSRKDCYSNAGCS
jgi:hypothetical protein